MVIYAVCYDVTDDKIRDKVAKELLKHGNRVQYSVFEVAIKSPVQLQQLQQRLQAIADDDTAIRFYRLCENCRQQSHDLENNPIADFPGMVVV